MANPPRPTVESLCREMQQQMLLLAALQPEREMLSIPRASLETWYNDLARVIVLWLAQQ